MSVSGGYSVMLQVSERTMQQVVEAFVRNQAHLFRVDLNRIMPLGDYGIDQTLFLGTQLVDPVVRLVTPDAVELELSLQALARLETRLAALPGGPVPSPAPEIEASFTGRIRIRVAGVFINTQDRRYMAVDLKALQVISFQFALGAGSIVLSERALATISALTRRAAVVALSKNVGVLPVSWTIGTDIPILGPVQIPIEFAYRVVSSSGGDRALALLLRIRNEGVDLNAVVYALRRPTDLGIFIELDLINEALTVLCQKLEGYRIFPDSGGVKGDLIFHDAEMRVEPGYFVLENIEVQSRTLQQVTKVIEKVICTAVKPCESLCESLFETIVEWVQLDQLANARGRFSPDVDAAGKLRVDASGISVNLSAPVALLVFTGVNAILPLGAVATATLMVVGKMLLDRAVEEMIDGESVDVVLDQPMPGTALRAVARPREIVWPSGTFAIMATCELVAP